MGLQRLAAPPVRRPGGVVPDAVWSKDISHPGDRHHMRDPAMAKSVKRRRLRGRAASVAD